ncbi:MAG: A/G-specific adenine glycosylase, partial [Candidatus Aminicenantes bacterium]|nr:A/G-specific adenine glycosylase [Candidatus Aminicenantes bacterium]
MSRNEKDPATFRKKILRWYERHARELLWRNSRDPYKIWVSEVMLQQTTVQAVLPYYQEWMKTFPDIESLSRAPSQKVLKTWQGLGYYQRAKNLHKASKIIVDKHQGLIPQDYDELRDLPGFGPYITAAVLSIAFDRPFPVMDANVRRVLMRIMGARGKADAKMDQKLLSFLKPYFP